ncbi:MAG: hypothetical protein GY738_15220, partial [Pseudoalteromonas sp.]|nr:hypothetical protein [Pseudoalteromonas sp.]
GTAEFEMVGTIFAVLLAVKEPLTLEEIDEILAGRGDSDEHLERTAAQWSVAVSINS